MAFQKLKHGLFLTKANFPQFVEQFNAMVDFCNNLRGDADVQNYSGVIKLDRSVNGHPVIRGDASKFGAVDEVKSTSKAGRYEISTIEDGVVTMENPYFCVGGKTYEGSETTANLTGGSTDVIALRISATGLDQNDSIEVYPSLTALQSAQSAMDYYTIPLYMVSTNVDEETGDESYSVVCDFRIGPDAAMGEFS